MYKSNNKYYNFMIATTTFITSTLATTKIGLFQH